MKLGSDTYLFDDFRLLPASRALLENGQPVPLGGRAMDLLLALVEQAVAGAPTSVERRGLVQINPGPKSPD
jgi:hypothetical protein